ncbi:MAG: peptidylprolyl isomerase [Acidimicrobiales bacterium]
MKRFLAALSALLVVALASAGCNASAVQPSAASVGTLSVSTSQLDASMTALKADTGFLCMSGSGTEPVTTGVGSGTWATSFADYVLTQLIKFGILDEMMAAHHLVAPAAQFSQAKAEAEQGVAQDLASLSSQSSPVSCPGTPTSIISGLGSSFGTRLIDNELNQEAYYAYLAGTTLQPSALLAWERTHVSEATESCTSVLGVASEAQATKIAHAIAGGASFATEATRYGESIGAGSGGAIGCLTPTDLSASLGSVVASLPIGTVSSPVSYNNLWLLFSVSSRHLEPLSSVIPQLAQIESAAFNAQYAKAIALTPITVSSVYGTLQRKPVQGGYSLAVVPPSSKACAYAISATAVGCTTTTAAGTGLAG